MEIKITVKGEATVTINHQSQAVTVAPAINVTNSAIAKEAMYLAIIAHLTNNNSKA